VGLMPAAPQRVFGARARSHQTEISSRSLSVAFYPAPAGPVAKFGSNLVFEETGDFHLRAQEADFERLVAVDWYNNPLWSSLLDENVVTALDACQHPSLALHGLR